MQHKANVDTLYYITRNISQQLRHARGAFIFTTHNDVVIIYSYSRNPSDIDLNAK